MSLITTLLNLQLKNEAGWCQEEKIGESSRGHHKRPCDIARKASGITK